MKQSIVRVINFISMEMDKIARWMLGISFSIFIVFGFIFKAYYEFDDSPSFRKNAVYDWLFIVGIVLLCVFIFAYREKIQQLFDNKIVFILSVLLWAFAVGLYIYWVPTVPMSDMRAVAEGAVRFAELDWHGMMQDDYWNIFPGNIYLTVFWGILLVPFPHSILMLKILNAAFAFGTIWFARLLAKECQVKYYNIVYIILLSFLSFVLYINCIYFDVPLLFFGVLGVYIYKKYDSLFFSTLVLCVACFLRNSGKIFLLAVIICYFIKHKNMFVDGTWKRRLVEICLSFILYKMILGNIYSFISSWIQMPSFKAYPPVNNFYIGINEAEFGFMDNDFSYDRTWQDYFNRIKEYGPWRMIKILSKKTFWLWTQGTYQVQRYAFGYDVASALEKFEYDTVLTGHLLTDGQILRQLINSFCRAQYYVMFILMTIQVWRKDNKEKFREFFYLFAGTFLIMIVYELKARYILHLLPYMIIIAVNEFEYIEKRIMKKRKG